MTVVIKASYIPIEDINTVCCHGYWPETYKGNLYLDYPVLKTMVKNRNLVYEFLQNASRYGIPVFTTAKDIVELSHHYEILIKQGNGVDNEILEAGNILRYIVNNLGVSVFHNGQILSKSKLDELIDCCFDPEVLKEL